MARLSHSTTKSKQADRSQHTQAVSNTVQVPFQRLFETKLGWIGFEGTQRGMTTLTFGHATRQDALDRLFFQSTWRSPSSEDEPPESIAPSASSVRMPAAQQLEPKWAHEAEELLTAYAAGEPVDLTQIPCDLHAKTRFEARVREQLAHVGYGRTISYGELAEAAGAPRAARAVGSVMARNPIPLVIACHRVLAANGKLGGYSAPSGLSMKERLLNLEQTSLPKTR